MNRMSFSWARDQLKAACPPCWLGPIERMCRWTKLLVVVYSVGRRQWVAHQWLAVPWGFSLFWPLLQYVVQPFNASHIEMHLLGLITRCLLIKTSLIHLSADSGGPQWLTKINRGPSPTTKPKKFFFSWQAPYNPNLDSSSTTHHQHHRHHYPSSPLSFRLKWILPSSTSIDTSNQLSTCQFQV